MSPEFESLIRIFSIAALAMAGMMIGVYFILKYANK
jgi:hypothetical protein